MKIKLLVQHSKNNKGKTQRCFSYLKKLSAVCILLIGQISYAQTGTWSKVTNLAPNENMGAMLLLTDGTIICHNSTGGSEGDGTGWNKLTPDAKGSYINGTWTTLASMHQERTVFPSQVLPSGKVWVAGGEYGEGDTAGEIYDPVANTWSRTEKVPGTQYNKPAGTSYNIYDGNSEMLPDGRILVGPQVGADPSYDCLYYTPSTNTWALAPNAIYNHDEAAWLKLPDSSILFVGIATCRSCRYRPQTSSWVLDAKLPDSIFDKYGEESGSAHLLPNGKAIFFGATGHNCIYTPSGTAAPGTWTRAADFPFIGGSETGMVDAPSVMLPNGHILMAVSPIGTSSSNEFLGPTYFLEYNYLTNTFTQVTSVLPGYGSNVLGTICQESLLLLLPDGSALMGIDQSGSLSKQYYIYTEAASTSPIPQGKPVINSILPDGCPYYKLTGKLFNGLSEGTGYGDDWQNYTNYPIVRLMNEAGDVYFCKTTDWNRIGAVMTDSLEDTTVFETPAALPSGTYSLVVIANGIASNPTIFSTLGAVTTITSEANCSGNTGSISANGSGGIAPYTYLWVGGATSDTLTGLSAGTYSLTITDYNGCTQSSTVTITSSTSLGISIATTNIHCSGLSDGSLMVNLSGGVSPYTYSWTGGATTSTISGLSIGTYTVGVVDHNGCSGTATAVVAAPGALGVSFHINAEAYCGGNTGSVSSIVSGGTTPYTYSWTGGAGTDSAAAGLSAGTYTLTVLDNCGVSSSATVSITQPAHALSTVASTFNNVLCNGDTTGTALATTSGGTAPYTYLWSDVNSQTSVDATGLIAGTYTVEVTDNNGCVQSASTVITQLAAMEIESGSTGTPSDTCTAAAYVSVSGGTAPYTYSWLPGNATTDTIKNQCQGVHCCTVTDAHGCTKKVCITISANPTGITEIDNSTAINMYPNPNNGSFTITGIMQGQVIELYNILGEKLSTVAATNNTVQFNITNKASGIYLVRVLNADGSLVTQKKIIKAQ